MLNSMTSSMSPFLTRISPRAWLMAGASAVLAVAALGFSSGAHARSDVNFSVGIATPGVVIGASNYPGYTPPVYGYQQQPVYVQPQPVYVQPRPVYVQPYPVYRPRPIYVQQPVYVAPPPVYYRGHGHHHRHHGHGHRGHGNGHRR